MKKYSKIISGRLAQSRGQNFEKILSDSAKRTHWDLVKIPLGARQVSADRLIRVKTPFDFVFVKKERVIFADAKTIKSKTYSHSQITGHQLNELLTFESHGHKSGYIVNFTELKKTVFYTASQLKNLQPGYSLSPQDGILVGENFIINLDRIFNYSRMTRPDENIPK